MLIELTSIETSPRPKAEDYMFLVEAMSYKFRQTGERIQDSEIYSICCEELVKAIDRFDLSLGEDPARFFARAMRNGIIEHYRYQRRKKRFVEFKDLPEEIVFENKSEFIYSLPVDVLKQLLDTADKNDLILLTDYYINKKSLSDIAVELDLTRMAVFNRVKRAIEKIRINNSKLIEEYGGIINVS